MPNPKKKDEKEKITSAMACDILYKCFLAITIRFFKLLIPFKIVIQKNMAYSKKNSSYFL